MVNLLTLSTSHFVNSHLVNIDQMEIGKWEMAKGELTKWELMKWELTKWEATDDTATVYSYTFKRPGYIDGTETVVCCPVKRVLNQRREWLASETLSRERPNSGPSRENDQL